MNFLLFYEKGLRAYKLLCLAKLLRRSLNETTRQQVFVNQHLTRAVPYCDFRKILIYQAVLLAVKFPLLPVLIPRMAIRSNHLVERFVPRCRRCH